MNIVEAQNDMRQAYFAGAPGILVSGLIWLASGITAMLSTQQISVFVFFFGGMLIYPLGILVSKLLKRSGKPKDANPLGKLGFESTFILFVGLFLSFSILEIRPNWFFAIMLMIIGVRYLIFSSIYGMRIYWGLGVVLTLAGGVVFYSDFSFYVGALLGGTIELIFSLVIFYFEKSKS